MGVRQMPVVITSPASRPTSGSPSSVASQVRAMRGSPGALAPIPRFVWPRTDAGARCLERSTSRQGAGVVGDQLCRADLGEVEIARGRNLDGGMQARNRVENLGGRIGGPLARRAPCDSLLCDRMGMNPYHEMRW